MKTKTTIIYTILTVIGILILINILSSRFFFRLDLTDDHRFSLSDATKDILKSMEEPVTVTAYFTEDLHPDIAYLRRDFKNMLTEYQNISHGMVAFEFIDPASDEALEQEIMQKGIAPAQFQGREKDEFKIQKIYLGAEIQMGDKSEVISILQSNIGMEYFLTTSIKKLSLQQKPLIGILQGHGEPSVNQLTHSIAQLSVLYEAQPVSLTDTTSELDKFTALAIIAPTDSFPENDLQQLDNFLAQGKGIFVALNRVDADLNTSAVGMPVNTGLEAWLAQKGIQVNENFVLDANCSMVGVQQEAMTPFGRGLVTRQVEFPYFPIIINFEDNPITAGLEQIGFNFVSSINFAGDSLVKYTPIIKSSEKSATQSASAYFNILKEWSDTDFPLSGQTLAATFEGPLSGNVNSKMVVVADGDFPLPVQQQSPNPDNINLLVNSIDWLSDDTGLINLRTKGTTLRPIRDDLSDGKRTFLKYLNFLLPILIAIIIGVVRAEMRRNKRIKRMEVGHV